MFAGKGRTGFGSMLTALLGMSWGAAGYAAEIAPGGDLRGAINALRPGEELVLAGGTYDVRERLSRHRDRHGGAADRHALEGRSARSDHPVRTRGAEHLRDLRLSILRRARHRVHRRLARRAADGLRLHHDRKLRDPRHRRRRDVRQLRRHVRRPEAPAQSHPSHQRHGRGHVPRLQQRCVPRREQPHRRQLHPSHERPHRRAGRRHRAEGRQLRQHRSATT